MGRRLRTTLPQTNKHLTPRWSYLSDFKRADQQHKEKMKRDFDHSHRVHNLPEIPDDQDVWVSSDGVTVPGTVHNTKVICCTNAVGGDSPKP